MLSIVTFLLLMSIPPFQIPENAYKANTFANDDEVFCEYVKVFSEQVALNRIRNVPFLRLDEFNYFNEVFSAYLRSVASDIYQLESLDATSVIELSNEFYNECRNTL